MMIFIKRNILWLIYLNEYEKSYSNKSRLSCYINVFQMYFAIHYWYSMFHDKVNNKCKIFKKLNQLINFSMKELFQESIFDLLTSNIAECYFKINIYQRTMNLFIPKRKWIFLNNNKNENNSHCFLHDW